MINFYLPGFSRKEQNAINLYFIDLLKNNPEYFYDDIHIAAVYDCFLGIYETIKRQLFIDFIYPKVGHEYNHWEANFDNGELIIYLE